MVDETSDDAPVLDLRGLKCPLPVLRTRKALRGLAPGGRIVVLCTDPMAAVDIPNLAREEGDAVEGRSGDGGMLRFVLRRAGPSASILLRVPV